MKGQNYSTVVILSAIFLCTAGCLQIKDTSGIKEYFQDQGRAEILAITIKEKYKNKKGSADYRNADMLYNRAAGAGNGWAKGILYDLRTTSVLDVSIEDYNNSPAAKAISDFLKLDQHPFYTMRLAFPTKGSHPPYAKDLPADQANLEKIGSSVEKLIEIVKKQHDRWVEQAISVIELQFSNARWTTFENTTTKWIDEKYKY